MATPSLFPSADSVDPRRTWLFSVRHPGEGRGPVALVEVTAGIAPPMASRIWAPAFAGVAAGAVVDVGAMVDVGAAVAEGAAVAVAAGWAGAAGTGALPGIATRSTGTLHRSARQ